MSEERGTGEIPAGQKFFDNIWLLMAIGIGLPTLVYTVWGLIEIMNAPSMPLVK